MKLRLPSLGHASEDDTQNVRRMLLLYLTTSTIAIINTPYRHKLLLSAASWLLIWLYCAYRYGTRRRGLKEGKRKAARAVGALLAASTICERVAGDPLASSAVSSLLPLCTAALLYVVYEVFGRDPKAASTASGDRARPWLPAHLRYLLALSVTALASFRGSYLSQQTMVLGIVAVFMQGLALVVVEMMNVTTSQDRRRKDSEHGINSPTGEAVRGLDTFIEATLEFTKLISSAAFLITSAASAYMEQLPYHEFVGPIVTAGLSNDLVFNNVSFLPVISILLAPVVSAFSTTLFLRLGLGFGATRTTIPCLWAAIGAQFWFQPSFYLTWSWVLYSIPAVLYWSTTPSVYSEHSGHWPKGRSSLLSMTVLILALTSSVMTALPSLSMHKVASSLTWHHDAVAPQIQQSDGKPLQLLDRTQHPIHLLSTAAQGRFNETVSRQSQDLAGAVTEYRRRYGVHPPPNFDRWFEYAKRKDAVLLDEFDSIYDTLLPFWAFEPFALRSRVQQAFGYDVNGLMTFMIRNGQIALMDGSREWLREALREMTADFVEFLPDMDIAFNIHDEPRVTVPDSELSKMVQRAVTVSLPEVLANQAPRNAFSRKPADMTDGKDYKQTTITRFNKIVHQPTWSHARLSCPSDSPARDYLEKTHDNRTSFGLDDLGFIYNTTAQSDICNSPSLSHTYGFFDRPNMFIPTQDLVPVFSQSKLSSFQDIIYPSPWYWADKVKYAEAQDMPWDEKESKLYWRGSTTGGYSRYGGWRRHHRQIAVQKINSPDDAKILKNHVVDGEGIADWQIETVKKAEYAGSLDVHFSDIGQCDDGDCHAQKEFFGVVKKEDQTAAWGYKYLLDMDGNAFSGRFIAFLKSNSLVFKMAIFKEWHMDWLQPWLHYVPLSLKGDEWLETVRYFAGEGEGKVMAKRMAEESKDWANKVLRKEDMQVYLFRLLLEYGRLMDEDREIIGYGGP